jgi:hypothetical protein
VGHFRDGVTEQAIRQWLTLYGSTHRCRPGRLRPLPYRVHRCGRARRCWEAAKPHDSPHRSIDRGAESNARFGAGCGKAGVVVSGGVPVRRLRSRLAGVSRANRTNAVWSSRCVSELIGEDAQDVRSILTMPHAFDGPEADCMRSGAR